MNSQILFLDSQQRSAEIARRAEARRRQRGGNAANPPAGEIVIRPSGEKDRGAIERLSQLEGRRLDGDVLLAEAGGEVRAAVGIASGAVIADPFQRTTELVELLERSRAHLVDAHRNGSSRLGRLGDAMRERLRSPRPPGAPTALGNETSLLR